jgi:hypothetical protein
VQDYWNGFNRLCLVKGCRRYLGPSDGLFCANYPSKRGRFAPCKRCWCAPCFVPLGFKPFLVRKQVDEEGVEVLEPGGETRFNSARPGDHLITPFQCKLCHFRNIQGHEPDPICCINRELLEYIHRALLDSFWARETKTIQKNLDDATMMMKFIERK